MTPFSVSPPSDPSDFSSFIPSIHTQPTKPLEHIIDGSLTDRKSIEEIEAKLLLGHYYQVHQIINGSYFSGTQKLCIMQHFLIPRIQWSCLYMRYLCLPQPDLNRRCPLLSASGSISIVLCLVWVFTLQFPPVLYQWSPSAKTFTWPTCLQLPSQIAGWYLGV